MLFSRCSQSISTLVEVPDGGADDSLLSVSSTRTLRW
ncbi:hypothetical protein J2753_000501 [Halolamina salifodinae]|uniref:Uncharacterized protein n=1 Tax=Halolamina salifodinae TaxID=1202767 RepID=A0A8T4GXT7_9EURY|nr:hypothetical protein [Halolamina salifodinae]